MSAQAVRWPLCAVKQSMHELSIALSIIEGVEEELANRGYNGTGQNERVEAVHLRLGALSGVVKEALLFSFEVARAGTRLEATRLEIDDVPAVLYCPTCECEQEAVSVQNLICSKCGTPSGDVRHGSELELVALELAPMESVDEHRTAAG